MSNMKGPGLVDRTRRQKWWESSSIPKATKLENLGWPFRPWMWFKPRRQRLSYILPSIDDLQNYDFASLD